jgi:hypothetical protein
MMTDFELQKELVNNYNDKITIEAQVENYKNTFAKELVNGRTGKEMLDSVKFGAQPVKIKKPVSMRISESMKSFKNKLKTVFGIE